MSRNIRGLRFLRTGLYLGEEKGNRFEPSQALAMALKKEDFDGTIDFSSEDERAIRYLKGERLWMWKTWRMQAERAGAWSAWTAFRWAGENWRAEGLRTSTIPAGGGKRMRLDKYLCEAGLGTRSQVKKLLKSGVVTVNGQTVLRPEEKLKETDRVAVSGRELSVARLEYWMLNKPAGFVSATEDARFQTVTELLPAEARRDLFPVGRLDRDTEGLLLLTNDGKLATFPAVSQAPCGQGLLRQGPRKSDERACEALRGRAGYRRREEDPAGGAGDPFGGRDSACFTGAPGRKGYRERRGA